VPHRLKRATRSHERPPTAETPGRRAHASSAGVKASGYPQI
jgi:hypothetical protein